MDWLWGIYEDASTAVEDWIENLFRPDTNLGIQGMMVATRSANALASMLPGPHGYGEEE